ncbi:hypothetical protein GIB67_012282 [Kingdonia uniflora]|uniref:Alcohol dehydrogenase-like N-terminal domain-containing protein n=1 Tax=Kingdonia uniflora TaxID=39325 RepID=A0A7J7LG58_9MAGN|nr:hypothetical protein GIB67_012282 [Kingdonia uniflora]
MMGSKRYISSPIALQLHSQFSCNFIIWYRDTAPDHASLTITNWGICYADVPWAKNIPRNTIYPVVPGHEIVGIVKEVGCNVCHFKVGDHVGVGPYVNFCKTCEHCKIQEEVHCDPETSHTFNSVDEDDAITRGGYSSYIVVQEGHIFKIPDNYPLVSAVPLLCTETAVYAPKMRYKVNKPGKSLGVVGLGGLGYLAVKLGKAFGSHVTVFSTSNSKKDEALNLLGADKFIISSNMQQMEHLNNFLDRSSHDTLSESDVQAFVERGLWSLEVSRLTLETSKYDNDQMFKSCDIKTDSKFTQVKGHVLSDPKVGGWTQGYDGFTFVSVRGAGHEVPLHRPQLALVLVKAFFSGIAMPTLPQVISDY